jgi:hypothetical protein
MFDLDQRNGGSGYWIYNYGFQEANKHGGHIFDSWEPTMSRKIELYICADRFQAAYSETNFLEITPKTWDFTACAFVIHKLPKKLESGC